MELIGAVRDCPGCGLDDSSFLPLIPVAVSVAGMVILTSLLIDAAVLAVRDRGIPGWLLPAAALAFGLMTSPMVILWWQVGRLSHALLLGFGVFGAPLAGAWIRRFDLSGWVLVGSSAPAVLWWAYFVVEDILSDDISYEPALALWLAVSVGLLLAGLAGIAIGDRTPAPAPRPARNEPDPERVVAMGFAIVNEDRIGPFHLAALASLGIGATVAVVITVALSRFGVPLLAAVVIAVGLFAVVATDLSYRTMPNRMARAMATLAFVGSWEADRFRRTAGHRVPTSERAARAWLAANPESDANRWVRPELQLWAGDIDGAYEVISRMPATTPDERFERLAMKTFADYVGGAPADLDPLRDAASAVGEPGSDERLRALAQVALAESRELLAAGDTDWMAPMLRAQELIGPSSLGTFRADTWRKRLAALAAVGTVYVAIGVIVAQLIA